MLIPIFVGIVATLIVGFVIYLTALGKLKKWIAITLAIILSLYWASVIVISLNIEM